MASVESLQNQIERLESQLASTRRQLERLQSGGAQWQRSDAKEWRLVDGEDINMLVRSDGGTLELYVRSESSNLKSSAKLGQALAEEFIDILSGLVGLT